MAKKRKPEIETEMRAAQPEEVAEWSQELAGLHVEEQELKRKAKAAAKQLKAELERIENRKTQLARMIITQQKEVALEPQMTFAEIEQQRKRERPLEESNREREEGRQNGDQPSAIAASEGFNPDVHTTLDEAAEEARAEPEAPDGNTLEGGLYRALHHFTDATGRWTVLREKGASDGELKQAISREFGISGSSSGPGLKPVSYKGGKDPAFWFGSSPPAKPTLKGKVLIEKAREVLRIPQPTDLDAAPRDPHKRNWSSLSDIELSEWAKDLRGMKGETAKQWLKRVEIEMELRDSIGELAADSRFELPKELRMPRSTYEDALRMAEQVKAEQQRRVATAEASIVEPSHAVKSDAFDLVPGDKRSWESLSDAELAQWKGRLENRRVLTALLGPGREGEADEYLERIQAVIRERDEAWSEAETEGAKSDVRAGAGKPARRAKAQGAAQDASK